MSCATSTDSFSCNLHVFILNIFQSKQVELYSNVLADFVILSVSMNDTAQLDFILITFSLFLRYEIYLPPFITLIPH